MRKPAKIINVRPAGPDHQVVTVAGEVAGYRRKPCGGCPWLVQNAGAFPAEAFRHSASTAYDMARNVFSCHESGIKPAHTCAGFLLRGAGHNMAVRIGYITGRYKDDVAGADAALHDSYRAMAVANGVAHDDPVLAPCR
ncbi:DUF6283 family protein [Polaromonas naphthalenivorans]|uniref:Uncharacterized protein n=1 Tax=Polaromonas naphthalenivorans (strain CJ2) TaxID=365044 RepID=A1VVF6_POLNA|nr:DUF6283 family protein [Polaromonas naphthalenivorans]ABM39634.1 conserved hypothetical protein [Polaromonas naphthalenivorans CJ2]